MKLTKPLVAVVEHQAPVFDVVGSSPTLIIFNNYPEKPNFKPLVSYKQRVELFDEFEFEASTFVKSDSNDALLSLSNNIKKVLLGFLTSQAKVFCF